MSVTFTLMPSARSAVMAGSPSIVAGTLTSRFGSAKRAEIVAGRRHRRVGVVRERGRHLEGDEAVRAARGVVDAAQQGARCRRCRRPRARGTPRRS